MRNVLVTFVTAMALFVFALPAFATNGTNIIGVGAISRSMGGVGVAAPQDAITAVFGNPAAMCYIPCETSEVDFAGTVFDPTIKAKATVGPFSFSGVSKGAPYAFPAIGIYTPISDNWRFGLAAYGVSGLGVDYKDTDLAGFPLGAFDIKTDLQVMKFAPNVAYMITPDLSIGVAIQVNWAQLDMGDGSSHDFGFGTQAGLSYNPIDILHLGLSYQTPQEHVFKRLTDFDGNGQRDTLRLEQPQQVVIGAALDVIPDMLMVEVDGKWFNWADANGYDDFGWEDQYVVAVGMQLKPVDWLAMRVGYNYGNNPVETHDGFNPFLVTEVQSNQMFVGQYEGFRIVGFPAIVEQHITAGLGVNITPNVSLNLGYMHAFEETISETSLGGILSYESTLSEDSYEFGVNIMF